MHYGYTFLWKKRRELDYLRFFPLGWKPEYPYPDDHGMQEIKLHNCEEQKTSRMGIYPEQALQAQYQEFKP